MLIFHRFVGEAFFVGEGPERIRVSIEDVRGGKVKVGIDGPRSVLVLRAELDPDAEAAAEARRPGARRR